MATTKQRKLTPKQESYKNNRVKGMSRIDAYLGSTYSTANMSKTSIYAESFRLDNHPLISQEIEKSVQRASAAAIMTREEALERLSVHARVKVTDICDFSFKEVGKEENGTPIMQTVWKMKNSEDIKPEVAMCIKSVSCGKDGPKIELYDSDGAIKQLSLMQGWNAASVYDHKSTDGSMSPTRELSDEEIRDQLESRGLRIDFDK